ncbi:unnamed protein product [Didymodactylos carnosus]|uniref:Glycoside hydrolase family 65 N-terminal domain-containing protein n=1 Tax=Didymodactylos carnosus TaxID=1234261 RepID=A0A8S2CRD7_9BILA|nr:unnamed protein product [Didymodactylos carnosus]CAF3565268.1 unnamed protein product [Didymodactylos carnosus]
MREATLTRKFKVTIAKKTIEVSALRFVSAATKEILAISYEVKALNDLVLSFDSQLNGDYVFELHSIDNKEVLVYGELGFFSIADLNIPKIAFTWGYLDEGNVNGGPA